MDMQEKGLVISGAILITRLSLCNTEAWRVRVCTWEFISEKNWLGCLELLRQLTGNLQFPMGPGDEKEGTRIFHVKAGTWDYICFRSFCRWNYIQTKYRRTCKAGGMGYSSGRILARAFKGGSSFE